MNKKNIKKIFLLFIAIILAVPSIFVSANNTGGGSGGGSSTVGGNWFYSSIGVRLSLYKYTGNELIYYGSVDYCAGYKTSSGAVRCPSEKSYRTTSKQAGRVAYENLDDYNKNKNNWKAGISKISSVNFVSNSSNSVFPNFFNEDITWDDTEKTIKEMFGFATSDKSKILTNIKNVFSSGAVHNKGNINNLTEKDLGSLYITVEPTMGLQAGNSSKLYYGTSYELAQLYSSGTDATSNMNKKLYYDIHRAMMAREIIGKKDAYGFVGKYITLVTGDLSKGYSKSSTRKENMAKVTTKNLGYGINVFWSGSYVSIASCTINESGNKKDYTLSINNMGSEPIYYDISNNINELRHNVQNNTYQANYSDTKIYGAVYNSSGEKVATCEIEREYKTCASTCSGKSGDDLLGCAENYCQYSSSNSSGKKSCIETCGYMDPGFSSCSSDSSVLGNNTVCDADTTASNKICTKANKNNYYKTVCTDKTTISYGNSLPVTITPGTGFTYTPTVSGSKTCEMTFEVSKWKFDYASSYTDEERNRLINILNQYNDVSDNSIWSRDLNGTYNYKSNDADIEIEVTNSNDSNNSNKKTTKKLIADKTINLLDKKIKITSGGSYIIPLYNSGKTTKAALGLIKTESSNKATYKLPGVCIDNKDGTIYDIKPNGKCDSKNDGPYYSYYTNLKIKKGQYNTNTSVNKTSSSLNVKNTCNYNINLPVSCSIAVTECTESSPNKAELRIENKNNLNITYGLSHNGYELNNLSNYILNNSMNHLYGAIGVDGDIVATCSIDLNVPTCDLEPKPDPDYPDKYTCTTKYSPSNYSEIKEYCSSSWMTDTANYASEKDCVNFCSTGANTCKNNPEVDTDDLESVTRFCSVKENRDANGYNKANYANPTLNEKHNIAMCINDCIDIPKDDDCLGIGCDYVYRPISLIDPFPNNRKAGYNWYGKEIYITDDLLNPVINPSGTEAEYIIELTPDIIKSINKNTDEYNKTKGKNAYIDYVYNDNEKEDGKYISKFIHSSDIENGGFGLYFTKK